jgi:hypothetical protein
MSARFWSAVASAVRHRLGRARSVAVGRVPDRKRRRCSAPAGAAAGVGRARRAVGWVERILAAIRRA